MHSAESEVTAKVEVDRAFATIGDPINFRITVTHNPDVTVLDIDPKEVLSDFEIKEVTDFSTKEEGKIIKGKNYVIINYALGEYVIRSFTIQYRAGESDVKELKTNNLYITIESVEKNKAPDADIKGVKGVRKIRGSMWLWWVHIGLLFVAEGTWLYYQKWRKKALEGTQERLLTPHEEAYQALNRLQYSDLIRKGQVKLYFFQMSEILRRYFERRYQMKALESTTYEVLLELKEKVTNKHLQLIEEVLSFCDLVKFAKYNPAPVEILRMNNQAKTIIDRTKEEVSETISEPVKN
jgi:hypothetical protein